jgi:thymidylate kinase
MKKTNSIKIGFSGTHSTGKTTAARELARRLREDGYSCGVVSGLVRTYVAKGYVVGREARLELNLALLSSFIERTLNYHSCDFVIWDRTLADFWAYARMSPKVPREWLKLLQIMSRLPMLRPNVLFYVPIEFHLETNGIRPQDFEYRRVADDRIREAITRFKWQFMLLSGSRVERRTFVYNCVRSHTISASNHKK